MRTYKRKPDRQTCSEKFMEQAVKKLKSGKLGYLAASKVYDVPKSSLEQTRTNEQLVQSKDLVIFI